MIVLLGASGCGGLALVMDLRSLASTLSVGCSAVLLCGGAVWCWAVACLGGGAVHVDQCSATLLVRGGEG